MSSHLQEKMESIFKVKLADSLEVCDISLRNTNFPIDGTEFLDKDMKKYARYLKVTENRELLMKNKLKKYQDKLKQEEQRKINKDKVLYDMEERIVII